MKEQQDNDVLETGAEISDAGLENPGVELDFPALVGFVAPAQLTEDDIADQFVTSNIDQVRYDPTTGNWHFWTGQRWDVDQTGRAYDLIRLLCRKLRNGNKAMASDCAVRGAENMASKDQRIVVAGDAWDNQPMLLGTPGGTVDLLTGLTRQSAREDHITKLTKVAPAPVGTPCPRFDAFLSQITGGDEPLERFLLQFAGYSLTGKTAEQALLFIHGQGGNGKSVFQNLQGEILGDYAKTAAPQTFAESRSPRHLTEVAMLKGARLILSSETSKDQVWSETRINQLTGGDLVTANFMRRDHFTFKPQFKLLIVGNHKPRLQSVNDATRRRFNIVPFDHKPVIVDPTLPEKLREEYPAILRKFIDGCIDWQKNGLVRPEVVLSATNAYFDEQDLVGRWIEERCNVGTALKTAVKLLFEDWTSFAKENGEQPGTATAFAGQLKNHGFQSKKSNTTSYLGIALKASI